MENKHQNIRKIIREIISESLKKSGMTTLYHGSHEDSDKFLNQKLIYLSTEQGFENISLLKEEELNSITDKIEIISGEEFLKRFVNLPEKMITKVLFNYEGEVGDLSMGEVLGKGEYFCATEDCIFHYENDDFFDGYSHAELNKNAKIGILDNPYSVDNNFFSEIRKYVDALYSPNENKYGYLGLVVYNSKILS